MFGLVAYSRACSLASTVVIRCSSPVFVRGLGTYSEEYIALLTGFVCRSLAGLDTGVGEYVGGKPKSPGRYICCSPSGDSEYAAAKSPGLFLVCRSASGCTLGGLGKYAFKDSTLPSPRARRSLSEFVLGLGGYAGGALLRDIGGGLFLCICCKNQSVDYWVRACSNILFYYVYNTAK